MALSVVGLQSFRFFFGEQMCHIDVSHWSHIEPRFICVWICWVCCQAGCQQRFVCLFLRALVGWVGLEAEGKRGYWGGWGVGREGRVDFRVRGDGIWGTRNRRVSRSGVEGRGWCRSSSCSASLVLFWLMLVISSLIVWSIILRDWLSSSSFLLACCSSLI